MTDGRPWTVRNLREFDDAAAAHGFGKLQEAAPRRTSWKPHGPP